MTTTFVLGVLEYINANFINPYTGEVLEIEGEYFVNNEYVYGGSGTSDTLLSSTHNQFFTLEDEHGNLLLDGFENFLMAGGDDILLLSSSENFLGDITVSMAGGDDILWSNIGNDRLNGGSGNDLIHGGHGNDTIEGDQDSDILIGGAGDDILNGGVDDDILEGGEGDDTYVFAEGDGVDILTDISGNDTLHFTGAIKLSDLSFNFDGDNLIITSDGLSGGDIRITIVDFGNGYVVENAVFDIGETFDLTSLLATDDIFIATADADIFDGGGGIDTVDYSESRDGVDINLLEGTAAKGFAEGDVLISIENIIGSKHSDNIVGNVEANVLSGLAGNDILNGGAGDDVLEGGEGSDYLQGGEGDDVLVYSGDAIWPKHFVAWNVGAPDHVINGDRVTVAPRYRSHDAFDGGEGHDTLQMSDAGDALFLDDRYSPNPIGNNTARIIDVEVIMAGGGDDIVDLTSKQFTYGDVSIFGEEGNDVLWGNAGDDIIDGGVGDDHLDGASGNDTIIGGAGNDIMHGRIGDDLMIFGDGEDKVHGGKGNDVFKIDVLDSKADHIYDFHVDPSHEKFVDFDAHNDKSNAIAKSNGISIDQDFLDVSEILSGYDPLEDAISDFVRMTEKGGNTMLHIDADGGGDDYVFAAILYDITGITDVEMLESSGILITS